MRRRSESGPLPAPSHPWSLRLFEGQHSPCPWSRLSPLIYSLSLPFSLTSPRPRLLRASSPSSQGCRPPRTARPARGGALPPQEAGFVLSRGQTLCCPGRVCAGRELCTTQGPAGVVEPADPRAPRRRHRGERHPLALRWPDTFCRDTCVPSPGRGRVYCVSGGERTRACPE